MTDSVLSGLKPLIVTYGGGHVQIAAAMARGFIEEGGEPEVIGLTTAFSALKKQEIAASSVETLLEPDQDKQWLSDAEEFVADHNHPEITNEQTKAYFALGLRDLAKAHGRSQALELVRSHGRTIFLPVDVFRRYLRKQQTDIVITTTSPRFELAALMAAKAEGIANLAIGDLFLEKERDWILSENYADHLAVLSTEVSDTLTRYGFPADRIRVTGNPAFDALSFQKDELPKRTKLRADWNIADRSLILCPAASAENSMIGRPFINTMDFAGAMESFCASNDDFVYMMRPHPNRPFELPSDFKNGLLGSTDKLSIEDAILMADVVCVETSTVGLQAALKGIPVVCVGFSDYVKYPAFGLAQGAETLDEALKLISRGLVTKPENFGMPPLGSATKNTLEYVSEIVKNFS